MVNINKRALEQLAQQASAKWQQAADDVFDSHANRPVDEVKAALISRYKSIGTVLPDAHLEEMARHISEGTRVNTRG